MISHLTYVPVLISVLAPAEAREGVFGREEIGGTEGLPTLRLVLGWNRWNAGTRLRDFGECFAKKFNCSGSGADHYRTHEFKFGIGFDFAARKGLHKADRFNDIHGVYFQIRTGATLFRFLSNRSAVAKLHSGYGDPRPEDSIIVDGQTMLNANSAESFDTSLMSPSAHGLGGFISSGACLGNRHHVAFCGESDFALYKILGIQGAAAKTSFMVGIHASLGRAYIFSMKFLVGIASFSVPGFNHYRPEDPLVKRHFRHYGLSVSVDFGRAHRSPR